MNIKQISLVQESYKLIEGQEHAFGIKFYEILFKNEPELRLLFKSDIHPQVEKLMSTLTTAIKNLNDLEGLIPVLSSLGKKHISYGVKPEHYPIVCSSLIESFNFVLGNRFSKEHTEAWDLLLKTVSSVMISAEN